MRCKMNNIWMDLTDAIDSGSSIPEMEKKYGSTYLILITNNKEERVVLYKGFLDGFHVFTDSEGVKIKLTQDTNYQLICSFPERKLFNHQGVAFEFMRLPNRQYRRGICKDNAKIYSPVKSLYNMDGHPWTIELLESALYAQYPSTCEEAIKDLQKREKLGVALSEKFMLSLSLEAKFPERLHLLYMNKLIGYFINNTFYIKHHLFKQEIFDNINLFKPYRIEF